MIYEIFGLQIRTLGHENMQSKWAHDLQEENDHLFIGVGGCNEFTLRVWDHGVSFWDTPSANGIPGTYDSTY